MSTIWVCPRCGCNSNHFSSSKCSLVCDSCGTEVKTEVERQEELNFQRNMALAKNHLKVGNWDEAKQIVKQYERSRPADKQVYLYLLVATTKCFEDYLIEDSVACQEAEVYWDKLTRLGCVNSAMRNYADDRAEKLKLIKDKFIAKKTLFVTISTVLTILAFLTVICGKIISIFFIVLAIIGWIHSYNWIKKNNSL